MEKVMNLSCYPSPYPQCVVALGHRWLAYPGNQPIASFNKQQPSTSDKMVEVAKEVAKDVATGLIYFGRNINDETHLSRPKSCL
jgi:hypothetical protein